MRKSLVTLTVALAIASVGSLVSDRAQAGASSSAPYKYRNWVPVADRYQAQNHHYQSRAQATKSDITSFSSSSAKSSRR
jgi:hypothetical protein